MKHEQKFNKMETPEKTLEARDKGYWEAVRGAVEVVVKTLPLCQGPMLCQESIALRRALERLVGILERVEYPLFAVEGSDPKLAVDMNHLESSQC